MSSTLEQTLSEAYDYLGPRDRTIAQVRAHLEQFGATEELIDATVTELTGHGYLDDSRYARCFAEDRRNLDSWGKERIYRKLLRLGIEQEIAVEASEPEDEDQELAVALELLRRRMRCPPTDPKARQRAVGMLLRRGYSWDLAYRALRRFEGRVT
ncbi:MAG TPA: regulatory protein RecX [Solirubrobacteraceae bacterium]|jgi:regulatory protein